MKKMDLLLILGFGCSLAALVTVIIPALSTMLAVCGILCSAFSLKHEQKYLARAGLFMGILALVMDIIYLLVTLIR